MGMAIHSTSVDQTVALGAAVGRVARAGDLIGLVGELGAGKTQFVRGLARGMGLDESAVSSPTFVMIQEYSPDDNTCMSREYAVSPAGRERAVLIHLDAYRLRSLDELESIGWDASSLLAGGEIRQSAVVVVEWADRLADLLGDDYLLVEFAHEDEHTRCITATFHGSWLDRHEPLTAAMNTAVKDQPRPRRRSFCPICEKPVADAMPTFPFCSDRCKTIDLGRWLDGRYIVSRPLDQADLDEDGSSSW